jgi:hypothetical protein
VLPPDVDFVARGIMRIEVRLSFEDQSAGLSFEDAFTFTDRGGREFFEYDYTAVERDDYHGTALLVLDNGLVLERDLGSLDVERLVLPSA